MHDWSHVKMVLKNALQSVARTVPRSVWSEAARADILNHEDDGDTQRSIGSCFWTPEHLRQKAAKACGYTVAPHEPSGNHVGINETDFSWEQGLQGFTEGDVQICDKVISRGMKDMPAHLQRTFRTLP